MITSNINQLISRLQKRFKRFRLSSAESKQKLARIALLLENQTKINIRRQGIVDTGNLLNSIQSRVSIRKNSATVSYGSFGVRYARLHEFGGPFTDRMRRAMFASFRARGSPPRAGKGIIQGGRFKARPYIRPSIIQQRRSILNILKEE
jgi:hypothetical protein